MTGHAAEPHGGTDPGAPPCTGNSVVDSALAAAADSHRLPLAEQADVLGSVHERLRAALDGDRNGGPAPH